MNVSLNGFNSKAATFVSASAEKGAPVAFCANNTVCSAAADTPFCGVCLDSRDGYATVLLCGYCKIPYSGTAPSVGYATLASDGAGGAKTVSSGGRSVLVTDVDTTAKVIGIIL